MEPLADPGKGRPPLGTAVRDGTATVVLSLDAGAVVRRITGTPVARMTSPPGDLLGRPVWDLFPDGSAAANAIRLGLEGKQAAAVHAHHEGATDVVCIPTLVEEGNPAVALCVLRDATSADRRRLLLQLVVDSAPVLLVATDREGTITFAEGGAACEGVPHLLALTGSGSEADFAAGNDIRAAFAARPDILELVGRALAGERVSARVQDGARAAECHFSPLYDAQGGPAGTVAFIVDVSQQAEGDVLRELAARFHGLEAPSRDSQPISGDGDLNQLLRRIAGRARDLTRARFAAISVFGDGGHLDRFVFEGMDEDQARKLGAPPVGRGLLGWLASQGDALRLADVTSHATFTGWPPGHPQMGPFLGVPIRSAGRTIGSLYMTRLGGEEPFTEAESFAAAILALQVAVAVSSGLAHERAGRVLLLEERVSIGHDLHDGTIQSLYALALECEARARESKDDTKALAAVIASGVSRIHQIITDIRQYIASLETGAPPSGPELSSDIPFAIRQLVPAGIEPLVTVAASALQELTPRESEDLLFIAREAISNAVRHGSPTRVAVDLRQTPTESILTVQDNGTGFDQLTVRTGLGTVTMKTRAARIGASFMTFSLTGMGTTVRVSVPRRFEEAAPEE